MALRKYTNTFTVGASAYSKVQVVTLSSWDAGDKFKLSYGGAKTAFFESGVNGTAAAIQTALRTLTGDTGLTVTGTTDAGPFTVTFVATPTDILTVTDGTGGCTGAVTVNQSARAISLKGYSPYIIYRIITDGSGASGSATYEVKESAPGTAELADESPADVALAAPGKLVDSITFSGDTFDDTDEVVVTVYYESAGDRRF